MHWSKRIIGPAEFDGYYPDVPMAAHVASDGSLYLILKQYDDNLREFWWTGTTSGAGDLTGHGVPPTVPEVGYGSILGGVASYVTADGRQHVVYVTKDRQLWELYWLGNQPAQGGDLLAQISAPHPNPSLSAYVFEPDRSQHAIYVDQHRRVIELQWSGNAAPAPQIAGGDTDRGFPADNLPICSHVNPHDGNSQHAFYLSGGEIIELRKAMGEGWQARNLTRISSGTPPPAVSGPASHVAADGTQHVFFVAATGEIFELWWPGNAAPQAENLTRQAGAPRAAINPGITRTPPVATHYVPSEDTQHVFFADQLGHPWEIWWRGPGPKTPEDLTKLAGAPTAHTWLPFHSLVAADGSQHVIIQSSSAAALVDLVARP